MKKLALVLTFAVLFGAGAVSADPGPYDGTMNADGYDATPDAVATPNQGSGAPEVHDILNHLLGTAYTANAETDVHQVTTQNSFWVDLGAGTAGDFAAISISADNLNTIGVYNTANLIDIPIVKDQTGLGFLGDGTNGSPYPGGVNPFVSGENFGFYIESVVATTNAVTRYDSDPTKNADGIDHMLAFYLPQLDGTKYWIQTDPNDTNTKSEITLTKDTYLLTWEDLNLNNPDFDSDYNDFSILVTRVAPVPEPMSMTLLGGGLLGLAGLRRKKNA